jgi:hypothetical protein
MANITVNSEKMKVKYYKLIRLRLHHNSIKLKTLRVFIISFILRIVG